MDSFKSGRLSESGWRLEKKLVSEIMLTLLPSFILLTMITLPVSATTTGGQITSDTIWTKANSPYIITSNLLVSEGVTLTIEHGVMVRFETDKLMQIDGELIARGTEAEPIIFTSIQTYPAPGGWRGIVFTDGAIDAVYNVAGNYISGSIMQYCTVQFSGAIEYTQNPPLMIISSSPFIDRCYIIHNGGGISISNSSSKITSNVIFNNSGFGDGGGIDVYGGDILIENNIISNNSISSIWGKGGGINIAGGGKAIINGNTIANNTANRGGGINIERGMATITWNIIIGNEVECNGGGIAISENSNLPVTISGNIINYNSVEEKGGGFLLSVVVVVESILRATM